MVNFARYYIEYLRDFFQNLWKLLKSIFDFFADLLVRNNIQYFKQLGNAWGDFNFLDWVFEFLVIIINVGFFGFLTVRFFQLCRRYIRFTKREVEKDILLEQIADLNANIAELVDEKNKILALKVNGLGLTGSNMTNGGYIGGENKEVKKNEDPKALVASTRFPKLSAVDLKYENELSLVSMNADDMVSLPQLVDRFINYSASQLHLYYDQHVIRTFFAGLATSKILILEGISGTGKTSLPYAMGKFFKNDTSIISVQPSWRDRAEMLGYLNEFTKKFNETDFLKSLYETTYRDDLNFIVLDEMNLARIEYYFAEFLSIMEMPNKDEWKIDIVPESLPDDPKHIINGKILVPQNVWFVGTANRDDSTFTITDKVYDRAVSIEMNHRAEFIDAPFTENINMTYEYFNSLMTKEKELHSISLANIDKLLKVDEFIANKFKITFGNRIMKQIKDFVPAYVACGGSEIRGLDYIFLRKILRKFEGLNLAFLKDEMNQLITLLNKLFGKGSFAESIAYLNELIKNY